MTMVYFSFIIGGFILGALTAFLVAKGALASRDQQKAVLATRLEMEQNRFREQSLSTEAKYNEQSALLKESREILGKEFENLANRIFDSKQEKFSKDNQRTLDSSIGPLREEITKFHKHIEDSHHRENAARSEMNGSIKELMKQTNLVRGEASNLASALKGDSKSQGNWGEMILERMLEESGLSSPREYVTQEPHLDQQGRRRLPDVIIHMPDQRDMVIDSKVSLTDYERYKNESDVVEQKKHLKQHINSVKVHIKELHEKSYEQLEGINTLDFVLLFIPIEGAFMLALQNDDMLFNDAYKKNIILSSPSTLMAMLKIVKNVWRFEDQNRNSQRISDEAGKLYDQMALVIESLDNIGEHIEKSQNAFEMAKKRMKTGKGNLMNRFDAIKKLGPNTKRNISQAWIDQDKNKEHLSLKHDLDDKK
jgi:DNA recombination protein RmuC